MLIDCLAIMLVETALQKKMYDCLHIYNRLGLGETPGKASPPDILIHNNNIIIIDTVYVISKGTEFSMFSLNC